MISPSSYFLTPVPADTPVFRRRHAIITYAEYRSHTAALCAVLKQTGARTAVLMTTDNYQFAVAMFAALHAEMNIVLPGNLSSGTAERLQAEGALLVTDQTGFAGAISILGHPESDAELLPFDATASDVWFYTSGSSGTPKRIHRTFATLEMELQLLADVLPEDEPAEVFTTSFFHHAYGIIFGFLLPLSRGLLSDTTPFHSPADFLARVDALATPGKLAWLVTTPAFIRVWADNPDVCPLHHRPLRIQSAGAPLPIPAAQTLHSLTNAEFFEIFGSSETGVAAHRNPLATQEWTPFRGVQLSPAQEGSMRIDSPCIPPGEHASPGDNARLLPNGNFLLLPRADNVVKIADKRISLAEVAQHLEACSLVKRAFALKLEGKTRPILAAVVTPTTEGYELLRSQGINAYRKALVIHLGHHLPTVLIPKKWRFVGDIPANAQGKTEMSTLHSFFHSRDYMPVLTPLETSPERLVARALYPVDAPWVPGHFPRHPITPGVVMLRSLSHLTKTYWGVTITRIQRLKFNAEVTPGSEIYIILERRDEKLSVLLSRSSDGKTPTGKGNCRISPAS